MVCKYIGQNFRTHIENHLLYCKYERWGSDLFEQKKCYLKYEIVIQVCRKIGFLQHDDRMYFLQHSCEHFLATAMYDFVFTTCTVSGGQMTWHWKRKALQPQPSPMKLTMWPTVSAKLL